jgi:hypothetical protein
MSLRSSTSTPAVGSSRNSTAAHGQRLGDQHAALHAARQLRILASRLSQSDSWRRTRSISASSRRLAEQPAREAHRVDDLLERLQR